MVPRGSALVEALAALTLLALAGLVVTTAAVASLRAVRQGMHVERALAVASGELAALAARRPLVDATERREEPSLSPTAVTESETQLADATVAALRVAVRLESRSPPVVLTTRVVVPP